MDCIAITHNGTQCSRKLSDNEINEGYTKCWQHRENNLINSFFSVNPQQGIGSILTSYLGNEEIDLLTAADENINRYRESIPYTQIKSLAIKEYLSLSPAERKRLEHIDVYADLDENRRNPEDTFELIQSIKNNKNLKTLKIANIDIDEEILSSLLSTIGSSLTTFGLWGVYIGETPECMEILANFLKTNTTLLSLDLQEDNIKTDGIQYLADTLRYNNTLKELKLVENYITDLDALYLASRLENNTSLEFLDLSNNKIDEDGAYYLEESLKNNTGLKELNLYGTDIPDSIIKEMRYILGTHIKIVQRDPNEQTDEVQKILEEDEEQETREQFMERYRIREQLFSQTTDDLGRMIQELVIMED